MTNQFSNLDYDDYLAHYGVKGMKWGERKRSYKSDLKSAKEKLDSDYARIDNKTSKLESDALARREYVRKQALASGVSKRKANRMAFNDKKASDMMSEASSYESKAVDKAVNDYRSKKKQVKSDFKDYKKNYKKNARKIRSEEYSKLKAAQQAADGSFTVGVSNLILDKNGAEKVRSAMVLSKLGVDSKTASEYANLGLVGEVLVTEAAIRNRKSKL